MIEQTGRTVVCQTEAEVSYIKSLEALTKALDSEWSKRVQILRDMYDISNTVFRTSSFSFLCPDDFFTRQEETVDVILAK